MRPSIHLFPILLTLTLCACSSVSPSSSRDGLLVMSYNAHNLFDAVDSGLEYPEFSVARGRWDEGRYRARLEGLARVIRAAAPEKRGPDVVCLMEIENRAVLEELRKGPLASSKYGSALMSPAAGQAVNCGILCRLPLLDFHAHGSLAGRAMGRYILEAAFDAGGTRLVVFACHWKSKLEGALATEGERRAAAALVEGRLAAILATDPGAEILVCGDFNEEPDEWDKVARAYPTALMPAGEAAGSLDASSLLVTTDAASPTLGPGPRPVFYSPWGKDGTWSYMMRGRGERIDGFLLSPGLLDGEGLFFESFSPLAEAFLLGASGSPLPYNPSTGAGFSDHLPIVLRLAFSDPR